MSHQGKAEVIVGVDGSPSADAAVKGAAHDAALRGATLTIVHAASPAIGTWLATPVSFDVLNMQREAGRDILDRAVKLSTETAGPALQVVAQELSLAPAMALVRMSHEAAMVVVGNSGTGRIARVVLGSVSMPVLHHARCPVAVVRETEPELAATGGVLQTSTAPVLLGADGSPASELAAEVALEEASRRGVGLVVVHAWWSPGHLEIPESDWKSILPEVEIEFDERFDQWRQRYPAVDVRRVIVRDSPAQEIARRSHDAQLVVVGSRGHGRVVGTMLGSVSTAVVQAVRTPVIVVRS